MLIDPKVKKLVIFNAGGGIETRSSFDGMNFNWDGFFSLFIMKSQKDLNEWKKFYKELKRLAGKLAVGTYSALKAILKMRHTFAKSKQNRALSRALRKIPRAIVQAKADQASGLEKAKQIEVDSKEKLIKNL